MALKLNSSGGGSVTLDAPVTANNYTLTAPASSGTIATTDGGNTTFTSITDSGNLTFTGTGNRITGDFSGAASSRVAFQTSTTNGATVVSAIPNGTATQTNFILYNSSSPDTNFSALNTFINASEVTFRSIQGGTGTYLPMTFYTGGSERMRIDTSGNVGIGGTNSGTYGKLEVQGSSYQAIAVRSTDASNVVLALAANSSNEARINTVSNHPMAFYTNNTERMRIDTSGNVGIGTNSVTSNAKLQVTGSDDTYVFVKSDGAGDYSLSLGSGGTPLIARGAGAPLAFGTVTNNSVITSWTEQMRIDSSGNVGIGTTSPGVKLVVAGANNTGIAAFTGNNNGNLPGSDNTSNLTIGANFSAGNGEVDYFHNSSVFSGTNGGHRFIQRTGASTWVDLFRTTQNLMQFYTAGGERMRIDSSGNLLVGTTALIGGSQGATATFRSSGKAAAFYTDYTPGGACAFTAGRGNDGGIAEFYNNSVSSSPVGGITVSGSTTTFNTSSDYRLKENIQPMQNALDVVQQLNPVRYTWKADGSDGQGFIAHELQAVVPDCVTGEKDAVDEEGNPVYQGIDTSFLVATLTAAIKELKQEIDILKAKVK